MELPKLPMGYRNVKEGEVVREGDLVYIGKKYGWKPFSTWLFRFGFKESSCIGRAYESIETGFCARPHF